MSEHNWKEYVVFEPILGENILYYRCEKCSIVLETTDQYSVDGKIYSIVGFAHYSKEEYIGKMMYDCDKAMSFIEKCRLLK